MFLLLLAAAAPALGVDGASCGKSAHRDEPLTQGSGVRGLRADQTTPVEERSDGRTALRGCYDVMRQENAHHVGWSRPKAPVNFLMLQG